MRILALALILSACAPDLPVERINLPGTACGGVLLTNGCVYTAEHCLPDGDGVRTNATWLDRDLRRLDQLDAEPAELGPMPALGARVCIASSSGDEICGEAVRYEPWAGPYRVVVLYPMEPNAHPGDSGSPAYTDDGKVFGVLTNATLEEGEPQETWVTVIPPEEAAATCD